MLFKNEKQTMQKLKISIFLSRDPSSTGLWGLIVVGTQISQTRNTDTNCAAWMASH
jgi:hypothetical protein